MAAIRCYWPACAASSKSTRLPRLRSLQLVEHYRSRGQLPQPPAREPGTLHVVVGNRTGEVRLFRQLPEFLVACNAWVPPPGSGYERAVCRALTLGADDFLEGVAVLRGTDVFIAHHGSE